MSSPDCSHSTKPVLRGIVKLTGGHIFRDGKIVKDDLWFDTGVKKTVDSDRVIKFDDDNSARIIDPQKRFWDAVKYKDYAAHMEFDISGLLAVPGYIDIQTNGAFGVDFTTAPGVLGKDIMESLIQRREGVDAVQFPHTVHTSPSPSHVDPHILATHGPIEGYDHAISSPSHLDHVILNPVARNPEHSGFARSTTAPNTMLNTHLILSRSASRSSIPDSSSTSSLASLASSPVGVVTTPRAMASSPTAPAFIPSSYSLTSPSPHLSRNASPMHKVSMHPTHFQTPSRAKAVLLAVQSRIGDKTRTNGDGTRTSGESRYTFMSRTGDTGVASDAKAGVCVDDAGEEVVTYVFEEDDEAFNDIITVPGADDNDADNMDKQHDTNAVGNPQVWEVSVPSVPCPDVSMVIPSPPTNSSHSQNHLSGLSASYLAASPGRPSPFDYIANCDRDLRLVGERFAQYGVTAYCPTVISSSTEVYNIVCSRFRRYMFNFEKARLQGGVLRQAQMLGLHLEGPFISIKGAHDPNVIHAPQSYAHVHEHYGGDKTLSITSIVTLAPELEGSADAIEKLSSQGIVVSLGHSKATFAQASSAVDHGAKLITHMFNAMTPFHHRDPGLIGLLGSHVHRVAYSIIADGIHAHPASVNIAYQSNPDGTVLVTDSMAAMGLGPGRYNLGAMEVEIKDNATGDKFAVVAGTSTLAGAIESLDQCVRNFTKFTKCPKETAILAATEHPARILGIYPRKGSLNVGADADIVLLHPETLQVMATLINGQLAYVRGLQFPPKI